MGSSLLRTCSAPAGFTSESFHSDKNWPGRKSLERPKLLAYLWRSCFSGAGLQVWTLGRGEQIITMGVPVLGSCVCQFICVDWQSRERNTETHIREGASIDKSKIRGGYEWSLEWDHFPSAGLVFVLQTSMQHLCRLSSLLRDEDPVGDTELGTTGQHCFQANVYLSLGPHSPRLGESPLRALRGFPRPRN